MPRRASLLFLLTLVPTAAAFAQEAPRLHTSRPAAAQLIKMPKEDAASRSVRFAERPGGAGEPEPPAGEGG